ncbi:hypothetical protein IQ235_00730 [Oscillatoriales cyanobacterium LEGE 11467]|uniref:Uncharacterized protein n=1 Tax=Zarconia navalis LEGE 11467 TaxID=1828826 RepID=A0A928VS11_9CYAN|nr:hypothetical protein [Zarconia navalis]MBE9039319.1 hypothetical protein [Zarconia navalis LEGE 11467]
MLLKLLSQFLAPNSDGSNPSHSCSVLDLDTSIDRSPPICAEALCELLDWTGNASRDDRLSAEGLEEILRYIDNG